MTSAFFCAAVLLCAVPFLAPCTFGVGAAASGLLSKVSEPLSENQQVAHLPTDQLRGWAHGPGPSLNVIPGSLIPTGSLVQDEHLAGARNASRRKHSLRTGAAQATEALAGLFAITDAASLGFLDINAPIEFSSMDPRRQLILSESPFLLLEGEDLRFSKDSAGRPAIARAGRRAKLSWIGPEGLCFALANRIHFRSGAGEIILEGMPAVASAGQYVRGDSLMSLNVRTRSVRVAGKVSITRF